jgi:hypothetical protein
LIFEFRRQKYIFYALYPLIRRFYLKKLFSPVE